MVLAAQRLSCGPRLRWYLKQKLTLAALSGTGLSYAVSSCTLSLEPAPAPHLLSKQQVSQPLNGKPLHHVSLC
jgi:hypothetical protein